MKKFVIERNLPGAANLSRDQLRYIAQAFCEAADRLKNPYTWLQSFIADDKIYCVHITEAKKPFVNIQDCKNSDQHHLRSENNNRCYSCQYLG